MDMRWCCKQKGWNWAEEKKIRVKEGVKRCKNRVYGYDTKLFPCGPPPQYWTGQHAFNFRVLMGSGAWASVWSYPKRCTHPIAGHTLCYAKREWNRVKLCCAVWFFHITHIISHRNWWFYIAIHVCLLGAVKESKILHWEPPEREGTWLHCNEAWFQCIELKCTEIGWNAMKFHMNCDEFRSNL